MRLLNHHTWKERGWRDYICSDCGCTRVWDQTLQRYIYTRFGKSHYTVPECRFENEPVHFDFNK
jgi:hypothetical protein